MQLSLTFFTVAAGLALVTAAPLQKRATIPITMSNGSSKTASVTVLYSGGSYPSFTLAPGSSYTTDVDSSTQGLNFKAVASDSSSGPVQFEFSLGSYAGADYYDISYIDGNGGFDGGSITCSSSGSTGTNLDCASSTNCDVAYYNPDDTQTHAGTGCGAYSIGLS